MMDVYTPEILFSTFFGEASSNGTMLRLERDNLLWLAGLVYSDSLSVKENAFQREYGGEGSADAFLAHIQLVPPTNLYSTYFGGEWQDEVYSFELLDGGRLALYGSTRLETWPVTPGVYDSVLEGVQQADGFITIFAPPDTIVLSTFVGREFHDEITAGARSSDGSFVVAGTTKDEAFPTTHDAIDSIFGPNIEGETTDLFMARLSSNLTSLEYGTYLGGEDHEFINNLWIQNETTIWIAGGTQSNSFPVTPDALRPQINWWDFDGFISCIGLTTRIGERIPIIVPSNFSPFAFPNPFNPTTTLSFTLPQLTNVTLKIHDILGREVERVELGRKTAGAHEFKVDGDEWASGLYFATLETPVFARTQKLLLLR